MNTFKAINPYNHEVNIEYTYHTKEEADEKLSLLKTGRAMGKNMPAFERAQILHNLAGLLAENIDELAQIITKEMGKILKESHMEIQRAIQTTTYSAEEARRINGMAYKTDTFSDTNERIGITFKHPLGIILGITPFNYPVNLAIHKIAPAFACGNCMLLKPSLQSYQSGKFLIDLCHRAGFPNEMIQFIMPDIEVMSYLTSHPDINCISFTGGVPTAHAIAKNSGFKKLVFELGGNDPLIVMDDADVALAAKTAAAQRFGTAGQRCTSPKRVFVHSSQYDKFKSELVSITEKLTLGDPMDPNTDVGPVVNERAAEIIKKRIDDAISDGATLVMGNVREENIIYPTILENLNLNSEIIRDETFGPVIPLIKFDDINEPAMCKNL